MYDFSCFIHPSLPPRFTVHTAFKESAHVKQWAAWVKSEQESLPLLKAAFDLGINTWDTADVYSDGASERVIAKAIEQYKIPRSKLVILSKCFFGVNEYDVLPSLPPSLLPPSLLPPPPPLFTPLHILTNNYRASIPQPVPV